MALAVASGQQPKPNAPPPPLPLLPAEQAWLYILSAPPAADAAMDARHVYVPLQSGEVVAIHRETGQPAWTAPVATAWPVVAGDGVVHVAADAALHTLDAATGAVRWTWPLERRLLTAPVAAGGRLIVVLEQGDYVSLDPETGVEQWRVRLGNDAPLFPPQAGADGRGYIALDSGELAAIAMKDGRLLWRQAIGGTLSLPSSGPDRVFVGSTDNYLYALDPDDGSLEWRWRSGGDVIGAGVGTDGGLYVASLDNILRAHNQGNGNQRWRQELPTRPAQPPRVIGNIVVSTGVAPVITAYATRDGRVAGTYTAPAEFQGGPLVDPELRPFRVSLVVLTRDGRLIGLTPVASLYREPPVTPLQDLPGTRLSREPAP